MRTFLRRTIRPRKQTRMQIRRHHAFGTTLFSSCFPYLTVGRSKQQGTRSCGGYVPKTQSVLTVSSREGHTTVS